VRGVDPSRTVVGCKSAGGGLAAFLVQHILDDDGPGPLTQWLFVSILDGRTGARRELDDIGHFAWDNRKNRPGVDRVRRTGPGASGLPPDAAVARRADLRGVPSAFTAVADIELFHDEDVGQAKALPRRV
jgi:acetyl esterase/lipase